MFYFFAFCPFAFEGTGHPVCSDERVRSNSEMPVVCEGKFWHPIPTTLFHNMRDQAEEQSCQLHPYAANGCQACSAEADVLMLGAPCHPFSTQRTTRFSEGSVRNHSEFSATMQDAVDMVATYTPKVVISEQVEGFDKPYEAGGTFTPKKESFSFQLRFQLSTFLISGFGFIRFCLENMGTRDKR